MFEGWCLVRNLFFSSSFLSLLFILNSNIPLSFLFVSSISSGTLCDLYFGELEQMVNSFLIVFLFLSCLPALTFPHRFAPGSLTLGAILKPAPPPPPSSAVPHLKVPFLFPFFLFSFSILFLFFLFFSEYHPSPPGSISISISSTFSPLLENPDHMVSLCRFSCGQTKVPTKRLF